MIRKAMSTKEGCVQICSVYALLRRKGWTCADRLCIRIAKKNIDQQPLIVARDGWMASEIKAVESCHSAQKMSKIASISTEQILRRDVYQRTLIAVQAGQFYLYFHSLAADAIVAPTISDSVKRD
jgi:hypothetical protein